MVCTCKAVELDGKVWHQEGCPMKGTRKLIGSGLKSVGLMFRDPGFEHETNDCVVKAMQAVTGVPYRDAHSVVAERFGRKPRHGVCVGYLARHSGTTTIFGFRFFMKVALPVGQSSRVATDSYGQRTRYVRPRFATLTQFVKSHRTGRYFVCSNSHAFAVIDGVVYDNGAAGARTQVTHVYEFIEDSKFSK